MPVIAIYSRKSKYTDKGESIKNQIDLCKEYAKNHFDVDKFLIYEDEGYSGGHADRPKFQQMIKDISKKKFSVLICYRLDRISRNITDFSNLVELLQENNIDFVSIREQFDTSTPMGRAMMYITSVFAQLERETIAERIKDNMHQLARKGRWLGGKTPTGYKSEPIFVDDKIKGRKKMYKLSPIPEQLKVVKTLYYKFLELGSLTQLESWTIGNNVKTKRKKYFNIGLITNLLRCKNCGSKMRITASKRKDKIYYYYKCLLKERSRGTKCNIKNLNGNLADKYIINEIKKINYKKSAVYNNLIAAKQRLKLETNTQDLKKENLEKELHEYEKAIDNLTLQLSHTHNSKQLNT